MIHFISGNPGGGKSYYALRQIIFELEHTKRGIVTNLAINLEAMAQWIHDNDKDIGDVHLSERIRFLNEGEAGKFYRYRVQKEPLPMVKKEGLEYEVPDYEAAKDEGVLYVIDEVHTYFGAREWFKTGTVVIWYQTQHRKLGDDVILISQHPEQVDKAMRRLAQDWTYLRNLGQEKTLGFVAPGWLRRSTYLKMKTGNDGQRAQETGMLKLDVEGLCQLYDTNAGVGITARVDAKKESKVRGMRPWMAPVLIIGGLILAWVLMKGGFEVFKTGFKSLISGKTEAISDATGFQKTNDVVQLPPLRDVDLGPAVLPPAPAFPDVFLVRVVIIGTKSRWELSNGYIVTPRTPGFLFGSEDWVQLEGVGRITKRAKPLSINRTPLSNNETVLGIMDR